MVLFVLQSNGRSLKGFKRGESWPGLHFIWYPGLFWRTNWRIKSRHVEINQGLFVQVKNIEIWTYVLALEMRIRGYIWELFIGWIIRAQRPVACERWERRKYEGKAEGKLTGIRPHTCSIGCHVTQWDRRLEEDKFNGEKSVICVLDF